MAKDIKVKATLEGGTIPAKANLSSGIVRASADIKDVIHETVPGDYVGPDVPRRGPSDLYSAGAFVYAPAGYYEGLSAQSVEISRTLDQPKITVSNTGLITATETISYGAFHEQGLSAERTKQLTQQKGKTVTPSDVEQTAVAAGKFTVGDVVVGPIPEKYYDMSAPMSFLGKDVTLLDGNLYSTTFALKNTGFNGWTPSTTAKAIVTSSTLTGKFTASDMDEYEYILVWECGVDLEYTGTPAQTALPLFGRTYLVQEIFRRPSSYVNIEAANDNGNTCATGVTANFLRYYGTTTGTVTYTWGASYGFYYSATAATFSSSTDDNPTVNVKTPALNARCSNTYFSTANAALVDQTESTGFIRGKLYRVKRSGFLKGVYDRVTALINE